MDNFRRPKRQKRTGTLDGIMNSRGPNPGSVSSFSRPQNNRSAQRKVGSGFSQPEGFQVKQRQVVAHRATSSQVPPVSRESKKADQTAKKSRNWRTVAKRASLTMVALVLIGGTFMGAKAFMNARRIFQGGGDAAALQSDVDPSLLNGEGDGRINILLLGKGGAGHEGPDLTDTILIASIDPIHKEAALVSVPRDLWVSPPDSNGYTKINSVYANALPGGEDEAQEAVEKTVEEAFGIPIHYHGMIDFEGFRKAIDTVGGVDVNVKEQLYDPSVAWENDWDPLIAAEGPQHFDGDKALLYVRSRHGSAGGDFSRGNRQREVIIALKDKILSAGTYSNPVKVAQLFDAFGDHIHTNFEQNELMRLYSLVKDIPSDKVTSVSLTDPPHDYFTTDMIAGQSVVIPRAGAGNYDELQGYIRNVLRDAYLRDENANIMVLNGTDITGLAGEQAEMLKAYGYSVGEVGDAPEKDYSHTELIDLRSGEKKYTKHYLEKRLDTTAKTTLPQGITTETADFVIIVGRDASQLTQN